MSDRTFKSTRNEDLKAGDIIRLWGGEKRITSIKPWQVTSPGFRNCPNENVFAVIEWTATTPAVVSPAQASGGTTLERGGFTDRAE